MSQEGIRPVVIGVDFGPGGDQAILESLRRVAEGRATKLHAVHVRDPSEVSRHAAMPGFFSDDKFLEQGPRAIRQRIDEVARSASATLPPEALQVHALIGKTADVLLQVAADYAADLIVVGTYARHRLDRLLGPVSEILVRTATCGVLVASSKDHTMLLRKTSERPPPPDPSDEAAESGVASQDLALSASTDQFFARCQR